MRPLFLSKAGKKNLIMVGAVACLAAHKDETLSLKISLFAGFWSVFETKGKVIFFKTCGKTKILHSRRIARKKFSKIPL